MGSQQSVIEHLVDEGLISAESVDELRQSDPSDLTTRILLDGHVDESTLLEHLARFYDCPPAGYTEGLYVQRSVFEEVTPAKVREYEIIPVRKRPDGPVDITVVEPLNEMARGVIEELVGAEINQYIWPIVRFLQARHFFLGDDLPDGVRSYLQKHPVQFGYASVDDDVDIQQALRDSTSLQVRRWSRDDVHDFIEACFDRDTLLKVLLGYAGHCLTNRLVVIFGKKGAQPYFIEEWPELEEKFRDVDELREIAVEVDSDSSLRTTTEPRSDDAESLGLRQLFDELGIDPPPLLSAIPVRLGGRTAMVLCGVPTDRDTAVRLDVPSESFDLESLVDIAERIGDQLETMIRRAREETLPPPAERVPTLPKPAREVGLGVEESLIEQNIARRRGDNKKRHEWEIVDLSEVDDESSVIDDISEASSPELGSGGASEVEEPVDSSPQLAEPSEPSQSDETLSPAKTAHGWIEHIEESAPEESEESSVPQPEASQPSSVEEESENSTVEESSGAEGEPSEVEEDESAEYDDDLAESSASESDDLEEVSTEDTAVVGWSQTAAKTLHEVSSDPSENSDVAVESPTAEKEMASGLSESEPIDESDTEEQTSSDVESANLGGHPSSAALDVPTGPSGVPMAQILRRPKELRQQSESAEDSTGAVADESSEQIVGTDTVDESEFEKRAPQTGETIMGVGELPPLGDDSEPDHGSDTGAESAQYDLDQSSSSVQDVDAESIAESEPSDPEESSEAVLDEVSSEAIAEPAAEESSAEDDPLEISAGALKDLESSPEAVELDEYLSRISGTDRDDAFEAAEELAEIGPAVLERLVPLFPGRLFVDRYQYTVDTMPPVNEHGPLLEVLVRIGEPSLAVVAEYIDDTSLECRFYATYLLTELPARRLLAELCTRLFDRDQQTRQFAGEIVFSRRHLDQFEPNIVEPLREIIADSDDDFRIEIAADHIRRFRDIHAVPHLIDRLDGHNERLQQTVHRALREVTFQPLSPSSSEWRNWWSDASGQPRWKWLIEAMDSGDEQIRGMVLDEIEQIPGVEVDYHPEQPSKLRARAQQELTEFFEENPPDRF